MTFLQIKTENSVERWTIVRPERGNALGTTLASELTAALGALNAKPEKPRALVLTATPVVNGARRTWIAGGDLKELATLGSGTEARAYAASLAAFIDGLDELAVPVIVAVDGDAIGGGAELALAGDIRIATKASRWVWKQLRAGLATGYGSAGRLVRTVGRARAQGLLFLGETFGIEDALRYGVAHRAADDEHGLAQLTDAVLAGLLQLAPEAIAAQKAMLQLAAKGSPDAAAGELALFAGLWRNPGHARFLAAFAAKAAPKP
jgi:enoyl-CoA hydratase/carnithine racemase